MTLRKTPSLLCNLLKTDCPHLSKAAASASHGGSHEGGVPRALLPGTQTGLTPRFLGTKFHPMLCTQTSFCSKLGLPGRARTGYQPRRCCQQLLRESEPHLPNPLICPVSPEGSQQGSPRIHSTGLVVASPGAPTGTRQRIQTKGLFTAHRPELPLAGQAPPVARDQAPGVGCRVTTGW